MKFRYYFLIIFLTFICNSSFSDEKKDFQNYEDHKSQLIKKKLLTNSFSKCEEYENNSSVELFLNCKKNNNKTKNKK